MESKWNRLAHLHFHIHIRYVPRRETPIFSPKFPLQSISFSQMNPLRGITISHLLPLRRPSFSKFIYLQAVHRRPRPTYCSQPERKAHFNARLAPTRAAHFYIPTNQNLGSRDSISRCKREVQLQLMGTEHSPDRQRFVASHGCDPRAYQMYVNMNAIIKLVYTSIRPICRLRCSSSTSGSASS